MVTSIEKRCTIIRLELDLEKVIFIQLLFHNRIMISKNRIRQPGNGFLMWFALRSHSSPVISFWFKK